MRLRRRLHPERGQSEVIGIALLIGVLVTLILGVGAVVIADWQSGAESGQRTAIQSDVTATGWTIEHMGGDSADPSEITVLLQRDADLRLSLDDANVAQTAGTRPRFESGTRWTSDFTTVQSGVVEILVIHQPSNTVLHEATYEVGQRGIELVVDDTTLQNGDTASYQVWRLFERDNRTEISGEAGLTVESRNRTIASVDETNTRITANGTGVVTIDASFDGFTATAGITVTEAGFDVTIDDVDDAVTAGDDVTVEYTASNAGSAETTQRITFAVNGSTEGTADVTLGPEETRSGTFTYRTTTADAPAIAVSVSSGDDTDTAVATVDTPPSFETTILNTSSPVVEGATLTVNATVENTGTAEGTQTIELLDFDGDTVDNRSVTLAGQRSRTVQLAWNTTVGDAGTGVIAVASDNDTATREATVRETAFFDVTIDGTNASVAEGDVLGVDVTVENTGEQTATQTIELLDFDNDTVDSQNVTLDGGANREFTFAWETQTGDAGDGEVTVTSDDDADTRAVTIDEPAFFAVTLDEVDDEVTAGETVTVNYTVENTGGVEATQDIEFNIGDKTVNSEGLTLDSGETSSDVFTYKSDRADAPEINVSVFSANDSTAETVRVLAIPQIKNELGKTKGNADVYEGSGPFFESIAFDGSEPPVCNLDTLMNGDTNEFCLGGPTWDGSLDKDEHVESFANYQIDDADWAPTDVNFQWSGLLSFDVDLELKFNHSGIHDPNKQITDGEYKIRYKLKALDGSDNILDHDPALTNTDLGTYTTDSESITIDIYREIGTFGDDFFALMVTIEIVDGDSNVVDEDHIVTPMGENT